MNLVNIKDMPKHVLDVPVNDLNGVYKVCTEMEALCKKERGIGLAAVQVGIPWRLFIALDHSGKFGYYINCDYTAKGKVSIFSLEGCLSIRSPGGQLRHFQVARHSNIIVTGHKLREIHNNGPELVPFSEEVHHTEGGVIFQHEIGHANGVLISDIGEEVFL